MTGLRIELLRTPSKWAAVPLLLASLAVVFLVGDDWAGSWPETSAAATRAAIPLMIAGMGLAAHRASGHSRSGSDLLLAARPAPQVELVRIAADAVWLGGVYVVCTVFTWIPTLGAPGGPWLEYALFGLSGIILALALGHIAGRVVPSRFTAAAAAIGGFLLFTLVFDSQSSPLTSIAFYHSIDVRLSATHLVWRVVICLLAVAAMSMADSLVRRAARTRGSAGAGGLVCGITLVCVLVMPGSGSALLEHRPTEDPVCRPGGGASVCVWPEHEHRLAEAVTTADKVARAAEGVLPPPARYTEQGLVRGGSGGFTLDHSSRDLLHTLLLQATDSSKRWCDTEPEDQMQARMYAGLRLDAWLEARATGSRTLPSYDYSGDTTWQDEVRQVLSLPERDQKETARKWVQVMGAPC